MPKCKYCGKTSYVHNGVCVNCLEDQTANATTIRHYPWTGHAAYKNFGRITEKFRGKFGVAAMGGPLLHSVRAGDIKVQMGAGTKPVSLAELAALFNVPHSFLTGLWVAEDSQTDAVLKSAIDTYIASTKLYVRLRDIAGNEVVNASLSDFLLLMRVESDLWTSILEAVQTAGVPTTGRVNTHALYNVLRVLMGRHVFEQACKRANIPTTIYI